MFFVKETYFILPKDMIIKRVFVRNNHVFKNMFLKNEKHVLFSSGDPITDAVIGLRICPNHVVQPGKVNILTYVNLADKDKLFLLAGRRYFC